MLCRTKRVIVHAALFSLTLGLTAGSCNGKPVIQLPPAETPVIESILDIDNRVNAAFHHTGVFVMSPGKRVELRLRVVYPTILKVKIDGKEIPEVTDTASHPELGNTGFYRTNAVEPLSAADPRFFWRLYVSLPTSLHGTVDHSIEVIDVSKDPAATGLQKEAVPLTLKVTRSNPSSPKPSSLFFSGPDAKHSNTGGDSAFIKHDVMLAGWLTVTPDRGLVDPATEDWHYDIWLDHDFITRNYPSVNRDLDGAVMPGRWFTALDATFHPNLRIPLTAGPPDAGTFLIPGTDLFTVELNAWHRSRHGGTTPPAWTGDIDPPNWPDLAWPFPVLRPSGIVNTEPGLQEGDYVIITGALVEDSAHLHFAADEVPTAEDRRHQCWFSSYQGHGGWLEIHPVDSIRRVPTTQAPKRRKHAQVVQACRKDFIPTPLLANKTLRPIPPDPPTDRSVLRFQELIDSRFTDMGTVLSHVVEVNPNTHTDLSVKIVLRADVDAHFKATYLLWWEEGNSPRPPPTATPTPTPKDPLPPICTKKPYLPQCDLKNDEDQDR